MSLKQLPSLVYAAALYLIAPITAVYSQAPATEDASPAQTSQTDDAQPDDSPLTDTERAEINSLIEDLGSSSFQARENASSQLLQFGGRLTELLKESQKRNTSPEVSVRTKLILDHLEKSGQAARIDVFMKRPSEAQKHGLYGWEAFSEIAGRNRMARQVFVGVLHRYPRFCKHNMSIDQLIAFQKELIETVEDSGFNADDDAIMADAVVGQYLSIKLKDRAEPELENIVSRLVFIAPYARELNQSNKEGTFKRITGSWLGTIKGDPTYPLIISLNNDLPEGAQLARRILAANPTGDSEYSLAMQALLRYGTRDDLPLIETFLDNARIAERNSVFLNGKVVESVQLFQDLALAAAIRIRELNMKEYFKDATEHPLRGYFPNTLIFTGPQADELRKGALEKYRMAVANQKSS